MATHKHTTRKHIHEESFPVSPERLFALLHTPSSIRQWWGADRVLVLAEPGGTWAGAWGGTEDEPHYLTVAKIRDFDPPRRMVLTDYRYRSSDGPLPFDADFVTEFVVEPHPDGALLRVTQDGFPSGSEADEFYAACETGWRDTFQGIRRYLADDSQD